MGREITFLGKAETEKEFRVSPELRQSRLDSVAVDDLEIGDGAWRVFINTKGKNAQEFPQEFLDFMGYITESTDRRAQESESQKIKTIHQRVREVKQSEKTGVKIMQRWEELVLEREEGRKEGEKEGLKAGRTYEIYSLV